MVGRVGTNTGVANGVTSQCPARPPIPRSIYPIEPVGNTPLLPRTISAICATAGGTPLTSVAPPPIRCTQPKRVWGEPSGVGAGYREERRAVRARNDELGKLIAEHSDRFMNSDWEAYVSSLRGRGDLAPVGMNVKAHPAKHMLQHLATKGAPAIMSTPPWELKQLEQRLKRGSHKSCNDNLDFLWEEMLDFVKKGFWMVLPYRLLKEKFKQKQHYL